MAPAFSATRGWFTGAFTAPTAAQEGVAGGRPAGRAGGPDRLGQDAGRVPGGAGPAGPRAAGRGPPLPGADVSPLKALAVDVERNLRSPLTGIRQARCASGCPSRRCGSGVRSGDTPAAERRAFARRPPDILITTPESLFLMLTSRPGRRCAGWRR